MFSSFSALAGCIAYLATSVVCGPSAITPSTTPVTEPALFTAIATLGKALMPIPIPGGQRARKPFLTQLCGSKAITSHHASCYDV